MGVEAYDSARSPSTPAANQPAGSTGGLELKPCAHLRALMRYPTAVGGRTACHKCALYCVVTRPDRATLFSFGSHDPLGWFPYRAALGRSLR
jgi:hypothetical protein